MTDAAAEVTTAALAVDTRIADLAAGRGKADTKTAVPEVKVRDKADIADITEALDIKVAHPSREKGSKAANSGPLRKAHHRVPRRKNRKLPSKEARECCYRKE